MRGKCSAPRGQLRRLLRLWLFCRRSPAPETNIAPSLLSSQSGEICLDILKSAWSPAWTLQSVCRAIIALMATAEPDSPLNCDAGNLLRAGDVRGFNSMARMYARENAGAGGT